MCYTANIWVQTMISEGGKCGRNPTTSNLRSAAIDLESVLQPYSDALSASVAVADLFIDSLVSLGEAFEPIQAGVDTTISVIQSAADQMDPVLEWADDTGILGTLQSIDEYVGGTYRIHSVRWLVSASTLSCRSP